MKLANAEAVRWPAERFYWAVLDASSLPTRRPSHEQLAFLLEPLVPQPLEDIHAVFVPLGGRRHLACAAGREELQEALAAGVVSLGPAGAPPFLEVPGDLVERIELLTDQFEPVPVKAGRRRMVVEALALGLAAVALALVAVERRVARWQDAEQVVRDGLAGVYEAALGPAATASALPLPLQLEAELRRLRRTRGGAGMPAGGDQQARDAARDAERVLAAWPADALVRVESLQVSGGTATVRGRADEPETVEELAGALAAVPGWSLDQPSLRSEQGEASFTMRLEARP